MKLSFTTMGTPDLDHRGALALATAHGYAGIDIRYHNLKGELPMDASEAQISAVAGDFSEAGIMMVSLMCYDTADNEAPDRWAYMADTLVQRLGVAARLDAGGIRMFGGAPREGETIAHYIDGSADAIREALRQTPQGPGIYLQNHRGSYTAREAIALAEAVNDPRFGLVFSPDHVVLMQEENFDDVLSAAVPWTREIYMADVPTVEGGGVPPGEGIVPLAEVVRVFEGRGFEGFYSFKWEKIWQPQLAEPEVVMPQYIDFMKSIV